jgi:hypothetical protein
MKKKVFVIGANKTGTTTMKSALSTLGYNLCPESVWYGNNRMINSFIKKDLNPFFGLVEEYDAFEDRPWNHSIFYQILNQRFPNSYFILTLRNPITWIKSVRNYSHITKNHPSYDKTSWVYYGVDDFLKIPDNRLIELYVARNNEIIRYFKDARNFLIMDLENGDKWDKLCSFLECEIPNFEFPHLNKTK